MLTFVAGAPATKLAFAQQPTNAAAGAVITPAIEVVIQDAAGNTVPGATNSVTVGPGANPGGARPGLRPDVGRTVGQFMGQSRCGIFPGIACGGAGFPWTKIASARGVISFSCSAGPCARRDFGSGNGGSSPPGPIGLTDHAAAMGQSVPRSVHRSASRGSPAAPQYAHLNAAVLI